MVHTAADFMWVAPGRCEGWCETCAGHGDLGPHTPSHSKLCRGCSFLWFATPLFDKALEALKEENSKALCFGNVKVRPYLLRLLTAMHTARISASTTRATTMISQSVGTDEGGEESMWMCPMWFCHFTELQKHNLFYFHELSHSFPSFHCLLGLQSLSVQIKHIFIIQLYTGQLRLNSPSLLSPVSTLVGIEELFHWFPSTAKEKA